MAIAIKIGYARQIPAGRKGRAGRTANEKVVVQIPDRRLLRAGFVKHIGLVPAPVKVGCSR